MGWTSLMGMAGIQPTVRGMSPEMNKKVIGVGVEIELNCGFWCVGIFGDQDVVGNRARPEETVSPEKKQRRGDGVAGSATIGDVGCHRFLVGGVIA
ncbi:hypothetical protein L1887_29519 [Cichorium endivia]|nr:hypothetical protein L1887_29519 [Cichorium endivia]